MAPRTKDPNENTRAADAGRKDKGDKGAAKVDETKGFDNQVAIPNGGESRDAVKEDRG
ncbi:MAG: hypothetical protein AB7E81_08510 [Hyphomicrobiaceae bacterium]